MAATWTLIQQGGVSVSSSQAETEAAPTLDTEGMALEGVHGITFWVDCGPGETVSTDTGHLEIYQYDNGQWGKVPALVLYMPPGSAGNQRVQMGTVSIDNPRGRLAAIATSLDTTATQVTIEQLATVDRRGIARSV